MSRNILVECIANICTESAGITRKGNRANLTSKEYKIYKAIGAVKRVYKKPCAKVDNKTIEGGDADERA